MDNLKTKFLLLSLVIVLFLSVYAITAAESDGVISDTQNDLKLSEDTIADATTVNKVIESMVRMAPEQYLWMHRRFKTAPDENENRYPGLEE